MYRSVFGFGIIVLALLGAGCPDPEDGPDCEPTSCAAQGATCGELEDGCGQTLSCGECTAPETCGGGGQANQCGACEATTCEAQGVTCGVVADGCGGELQCGPPCTPLRPGEPVIVTGDHLALLEGVDFRTLRLFRWTGTAFEQIRSQVDERVNRTIDFNMPPYVIHSPELSFVYQNWGSAALMDDGLVWAVDGDDELVFFASDAGQPAPPSAWVEGAHARRIEILVTDPLDGQHAAVYAFTFAGEPPASLSPQVTYERDISSESTTVTTPLYAAGYVGRWTFDRLEIGGQPDMIDRFKGRAFERSAEGETEELWDQYSSYVGDRSGPVRSIREVQGAASGVTTTYIAEYYPDRIRTTTYLRVHEIHDVWQYVDYHSGHGDMTYTDNVAAGDVTVDGQPDTLSAELRTWASVASSVGTLVHLYELLDDAPLLNGVEADLAYFYGDSATGPTDGTGEDEPALWGAHGHHILNFCIPLSGSPPPCANNDPAAEVCCVWTPPGESPMSVGSSFYPLIMRHTLILRAPGEAVDPAQFRSWLDHPLTIAVEAQVR